jgi:hypothetical protein
LFLISFIKPIYSKYIIFGILIKMDGLRRLNRFVEKQRFSFKIELYF